MKRLLVLATAALVLAGCSSTNEESSSTETTAASATTTAQSSSAAAPSSSESSAQQTSGAEATSEASTGEMKAVDASNGTGIFSDGKDFYFCNSSPYSDGMPAEAGECVGPMSEQEAKSAYEQAMKRLEPEF